MKASGIDPASLDSTEENKLQSGMAMTVQKLLKQRHAREKLFQKDFIGLRSDLALRRELRLPIEKVNILKFYSFSLVFKKREKNRCKSCDIEMINKLLRF